MWKVWVVSHHLLANAWPTQYWQPSRRRRRSDSKPVALTQALVLVVSDLCHSNRVLELPLPKYDSSPWKCQKQVDKDHIERKLSERRALQHLLGIKLHPHGQACVHILVSMCVHGGSLCAHVLWTSMYMHARCMRTDGPNMHTKHAHAWMNPERVHRYFQPSLDQNPSKTCFYLS